MFLFNKLIKRSIPRISYLAEDADWIIKRIGKELELRLDVEKYNFEICTNLTEIKKSDVIHLGSRNVLDLNELVKLRKLTKRIVLTWFHGDDDDFGLIQNLLTNIHLIDVIHTASSIHSQKLISWGVSPKKIQIIPLGIDNNIFHLKSVSSKREIRKILGFNEEDIIIGSFQKDGNGWGAGETPKLIKGPDILCDVVENIAKQLRIKVLLTGPARGYVVNRLTKANIPYYHKYLDSYEEVVKYFHAIDLYLVTSRNEGGPMALLESFATGTSIISSRVGMADDIIQDGVNGYLCEVGDINKFTEKAIQILNNPGSSTLVKAKELAHRLDWSHVVQLYLEKLYNFRA